MAIEAKRGCGYRKVGGLYMVGGGVGVPCDRLPFELSVCACCGQGIKQALGWTWIDVGKFFAGAHREWDNGDTNPCGCPGITIGQIKFPCALCHHPETLGRAGLIWVGEKFYKTPDDFLREGLAMGFSRRIKAVPQGFKIGETYIMLAHAKAVVKDCPGIFYVWLPSRLERIYKESDRESEEVKADAKRGIQAVFVPDNDPDHQGNVHDDHAREQRKKREEE